LILKLVMAGLDPAIPLRMEMLCQFDRDHRVTPLRGGLVMTK